ncbi:MAG TPA: ABC transporter ATP-binding protein, partial [Chloroflexota bacterium]|nr:ABC transporter ATP-binding protein [Chloroflexota bacterium]
QRVVIALALASNPALLILDEPTTGLDATVEAAVLDLVAELRREYEAAILFISHNLAIVARMCDRIGVLYAGRMVEEGPTRQVFSAPRHPYTLGLLGCVPRFGVRKDSVRLVPIRGQMPGPGARGGSCTFAPRCPYVRDRCRQSEPPLLEPEPGRHSRCFFWNELPPTAADYIAQISEAQATTPRDTEEQGGHPAAPRAPVLVTDQLAKTFSGGDGRVVQAVAGVSLQVRRGRTFGLVGESGSGKSTLARVVAGLLPATAGRVSLDGKDVTMVVERRSRDTLKRLQMVFQSPEATLNPQHRVGSILARSVRSFTGLRGAALRERIQMLAASVNLDPALLDRYPRQLSGGQRQRVAIARAFAGDPELVLCDEPASALDVSVQAAILNLLVDIQEQRKASYIFISHDLTVVRYLADDIGVMYLGQLVEVGPAERVFAPPFHPYTELLFSAIPTLELTAAHAAPSGRATAGMPAQAADGPQLTAGEALQPTGCPFRLRCPRVLGPKCAEDPPWRPTADGHAIRCWIPVETLAEDQRTLGAGSTVGAQ